MERENERRAEQRVSATLEVRFESVEEAARMFKTYSLNLSPGGICIRSTRHHKPGELLRLSLELGKEKFELRGKVAWAQENVMGIRFEGMSPAERLRLAAALGTAKLTSTRPLQS
ncbi:MAG: PilZ domain-containing protein [Cystobacterineae bacterium]|nr:PilZ domain-containing protein [Cystobacterineae bacterium]